MKNKKLLAIILLSLSFCLVSGAGYGKVNELWLGRNAPMIDVKLMEARIDYMMFENESFLRVNYYYDELGLWAEEFPAGVSRTRGKIIILILDSRGFFEGKTGGYLLLEFEKRLFSMKHGLGYLCSDVENDVVASFKDKNGKGLGYFYQGEYHLWEE